MSWCPELRLESKDLFYFHHYSLLATMFLLPLGGKHVQTSLLVLEVSAQGQCYMCVRTNWSYVMNMHMLQLKAVYDARRDTT